MKNESGLTLIELLVTVAVVIIMLVIGVPQYQQMTNNNRLVSSINSIAGDLNLARSEAAKRGVVVTVCGSTDGATCDSVNWESGWIAFTDPNGDNVVDAGDILISRRSALSAGQTLRTISFDNLGVVQYRPNGELRDNNNDGSNQGTFTICDNLTTGSRQQRARGSNVNRLGRISVAVDLEADNIVNNINGIGPANNVVCP